MPNTLHLLALLAALSGIRSGTAPSEVREHARLQTRLEVAGEPLDGPTRAKLVISRGVGVLWSNDGSGDYAQQPEGSVDVEVRDGELSLELGAEPMRPLPAGLLEQPESLALHLWIEVDGRFLKVPGALPVGTESRPAGAPGLGLRRSERVVREKLEREGHEQDADDAEREDEATGIAEALAMRRMMRLDERGQLPLDALVKAKRQLDAMPVLQPGEGLTKDAGLVSWNWLGPGNVGGRIRTILTHPTQPNTLWIGSVSGGIWKTTNGGVSWAPVNDFMANLAVTSLVMKPGDPSVMYAATGEGFGNADALPGAGVFKSIDGGVTWSQLASTTSGVWSFVNRLATVPSQPSWVFAVLANGSVRRSTDNGLTWPAVLTTGELGTDVGVHPTAGWVAVGTNRSLWTSNSWGAAGTWTNHSSGLANKLPAPPPAGVANARCEVAFANTPTVTIYASIDRNGGEIWRSTDGAAATWSLRSTGSNFLGGQGGYANTIWVSPTSSQLVVVGGLDLYRSTTGGTSLGKISKWEEFHTGKSAHADHHTIVHAAGFDGSLNSTVFFGNDGGIQKTTNIYAVDETKYWYSLANQLGITQFYGGACAPDGSVMIGGAQDNDTLRYTPAGGTEGWYQAEAGDGGVCAVDWSDPSRLYAEYVQLEIERSTDGGNSYQNKINGLADAQNSCTAGFIAPFEMDPNAASTLIAGGESIWRTTNRADNWSAIRGPITDPFWTGSKPSSCANPNSPLCSAIAIAKGNSNVIWVGYRSGRVSRTLNGGASWSNPDISLPKNRAVSDIAIHPHDSNQVFVTFGGYQTQSIWYTDDGGVSWSDRTGTAPNSLPPIQLNTVTFHPAKPTWVYVGTDLGVLASEDLGLTWSVLPAIPGVGHEGPANTEVAHLFWQGGSSLIAATFGRGMFRATPFVALYVDKLHTGAEQGTFELPFKSVAAAQAAATPGTVIVIKGGTYLEAPMLFTASGSLEAVGGGVVIQ